MGQEDETTKPQQQQQQQTRQQKAKQRARQQPPAQQSNHNAAAHDVVTTPGSSGNQNTARRNAGPNRNGNNGRNVPRNDNNYRRTHPRNRFEDMSAIERNDRMRGDHALMLHEMHMFATDDEVLVVVVMGVVQRRPQGVMQRLRALLMG
ncbi:hypothetical protein B566_EDAN001628 [Ephemera danica]|nr:hypothetical protein B566_EDAN001628 [Ephemera danica]